LSIVIDSSVALAFLFQEEPTQGINQIWEQVGVSGAWVPGLWKLEVANVLELKMRRGSYNAAFRDGCLEDLALLPIQIDLEGDTHAWGKTLQIANRHALTLYDACYLELALRRNLPLASLDQDLVKAARSEGVAVLPKD
jgi:predicted nucleic acid-binding protein